MKGFAVACSDLRCCAFRSGKGGSVRKRWAKGSLEGRLGPQTVATMLLDGQLGPPLLRAMLSQGRLGAQTLGEGLA